MKSYIRKTGKQMREYWNNSMQSMKRQMSRGAQNIFRMMPWARNESWRRNDKKQHRG